MASVVGKVVGGQPQEHTADTVGELKGKMNLDGNYSAQVNGEPASMGDSLNDYDFVTFTQSVKGGSF